MTSFTSTTAEAASDQASLLSAAMGLTSLRSQSPRSPSAAAANASAYETASVGETTAGDGDSTVVRELLMPREETELREDPTSVLPTGAAAAVDEYEPLPIGVGIAQILPGPAPGPGTRPTAPILAVTSYPHSTGTTHPLTFVTAVATGTPGGGQHLPPSPPEAVRPGAIHPEAMAGYGTHQIAAATPLPNQGPHSLPAEAAPVGIAPSVFPPMGMAPAYVLPPGLALATHHPQFFHHHQLAPCVQVGPVGLPQPMSASATTYRQLPQCLPNAKTFPQTLYEVVSSPDHADVVSWLPHGGGIVIYDKKRFSSEILPRYFAGGKFKSFAQKLLRWGFARLKVDGAEQGAYCCTHFRRGQPHLLSYMSYRDDWQCVEMKRRLALEAKERTEGNVQGENPEAGKVLPGFVDSAKLPSKAGKFEPWAEANAMVGYQLRAESSSHSAHSAETEPTTPAKNNQPVTVHVGNKAKLETARKFTYPPPEPVRAPAPVIKRNTAPPLVAGIHPHQVAGSNPPSAIANTYPPQAFAGANTHRAVAHPAQAPGVTHRVQTTGARPPLGTPHRERQILSPQRSLFGDNTSIGGSHPSFTQHTFSPETASLAAAQRVTPNEESERKRILEVEHAARVPEAKRHQAIDVHSPPVRRDIASEGDLGDGARRVLMTRDMEKEFQEYLEFERRTEEARRSLG